MLQLTFSSWLIHEIEKKCVLFLRETEKKIDQI